MFGLFGIGAAGFIDWLDMIEEFNLLDVVSKKVVQPEPWGLVGKG